MEERGELLEFVGKVYEYLSHTPATGSDCGWRTSAELFFRCTACGYMMNGNPETTDRCWCGALSKDADAARFGSRLGDDAIEAYQLALNNPVGEILGNLSSYVKNRRFR